MPTPYRLNPALGPQGEFARKGCDTTQRNLLLAFLPYLGTPLSGSGAEAGTRKRVEFGLDFLREAIGPWKLVWGPGVFQPVSNTVAANTMFVAQNEDTDELFVSIAGTNPFSAYAWFVEDFDVSETVRWQYGDAPVTAELSMATQKGLLALQGIVPHAGPGQDTSLQNFFEATFAKPGHDIEITVSGHSLGGALSPALGLWLLDTQERWDVHDRASVSVMSFAGPTPGNEEFATYITERFGNRLDRVANPYDVVTHAWNVGSMAPVKALYTPEIPRDSFFDQANNFAISSTRGIRYQQIGRNPTILAGSVNADIINARLPALFNIISQVLYQHTLAYFELIGVPYIERQESVFHHLVRELDHVVAAILERSGAPWFITGPIRTATGIAAAIYARLAGTDRH